MEQEGPRREGGIDWDAIKHAVLYSGRSYRRISDDLGSCEKTIANKARKEGWVRIVPLEPLPCGRHARPAGAPRAKRPTADQIRRRQMVQRLFKVLDAKLREIEERMTVRDRDTARPRSAADAERRASNQGRERKGDGRRCGQTPPGSCAPP
jgi:hypothetical protein